MYIFIYFSINNRSLFKKKKKKLKWIMESISIAIEKKSNKWLSIDLGNLKNLMGPLTIGNGNGNN